MSWELRNVGWPIPIKNDWPINTETNKPKPDYYIFKHRDELFVQPWGYTQFISDYYKGHQIDVWV